MNGQINTDEFDEPLGGLKNLGRIHLQTTHMAGAVGEIRFLSNRDDFPEQDAVAIWQGMGRDSFPIFERHAINVLNLTVTPTRQDQSHQIQNGWALASADRGTTLMLMPSMVVLQTQVYDRFSTSLGEPLAHAAQLFVETTGATHVQRIGLRYINRLSHADAIRPDFWSTHVRAPFAGPLNADLSHLVTGFYQQTQLQLDETAGARLNSGVYKEESLENRYGFLIDLDVFREQAIEYDFVLCANQTRQLNRTALTLFAHVLSEQDLIQLGPTSLEDSE